MTDKIKIAINGFGRIGRAVHRIARKDTRFEVIWINDLNPDEKNVCYMYNYDSIQGVSHGDDALQSISSNLLRMGAEGPTIGYSREAEIQALDCAGIDVLVDASGISSHGAGLNELKQKYPKLKVLVTHIHPDAECYLVLGANHDKHDISDMSVLSSSICDSTALAPVLRALDESYGVKQGHITTVHPWLNYQNLLDGPSTSWANPGQIYHHYPLGRSAPDNLIPKPTTAVAATLKSLPGFGAKISSFSYRVPTSIVGSANLVLQLDKSPSSKDELVETLMAFDAQHPWPLFAINNEPLISRDFVNRRESAIIDERWIELIDSQVHLVLWYDNEYGYACRVLDQVDYIWSRGKS